MNTMSFKGYTARVQYDDEDEVFFGRLAGIEDGVNFHGQTVQDLRAAFQEAVEDYLRTCEKIGKPPQKPYSGRIMVRVAPEVHQRAALAAQLSGKSLNQWTEDVLREVTDRTLPA